MVGARRQVPSVETLTLACWTAVAFAGIDAFYALGGTISPVYLAGAAARGVILVALLVGLRGQRLARSRSSG